MTTHEFRTTRIIVRQYLGLSDQSFFVVVIPHIATEVVRSFSHETRTPLDCCRIWYMRAIRVFQDDLSVGIKAFSCAE